LSLKKEALPWFSTKPQKSEFILPSKQVRTQLMFLGLAKMIVA